MMQIIIASNNPHKKDEIQAIFQFRDIHLSDLSLFPEIPEPVEDGDSFTANALIKARYYFDKVRLPVIADDSGLVVPALNGEPGIFSARYAGPESDYQKNNRKLLARMRHIPAGQRQAFFICCAVFLDGEIAIEAEGKLTGTIGFEPRGEYGFGYDPLFLPDGLNITLAELPPSEKNRISHRHLAFTRLKAEMERIRY